MLKGLICKDKEFVLTICPSLGEHSIPLYIPSVLIQLPTKNLEDIVIIQRNVLPKALIYIGEEYQEVSRPAEGRLNLRYTHDRRILVETLPEIDIEEK
jgi:hypothetical protein